jgi:hypothetical protein
MGSLSTLYGEPSFNCAHLSFLQYGMNGGENAPRVQRLTPSSTAPSAPPRSFQRAMACAPFRSRGACAPHFATAWLQEIEMRPFNFVACIGTMNRGHRSLLPAIGAQFSLSLRERAGVRESVPNADICPGTQAGAFTRRPSFHLSPNQRFIKD